MTDALAPKRLRRKDLRSDPLDPSRHLGGGTARERQQHDAAGIDAVDDEVRHPMRQRVGLAGAGAGDDQQRAGLGEGRAAVLHGAPLLRVELGEMGGGHRLRRRESGMP